MTRSLIIFLFGHRLACFPWAAQESLVVSTPHQSAPAFWLLSGFPLSSFRLLADLLYLALVVRLVALWSLFLFLCRLFKSVEWLVASLLQFFSHHFSWPLPIFRLISPCADQFCAIFASKESRTHAQNYKPLD